MGLVCSLRLQMQTQMQGRRGADGQNMKSSRLGSILGTPSETGVEISGGRWWGGVDEVVVAVGHCVHKWEVGEQSEGQKSKIELPGLDFGWAVRNGEECRWGEAVRWHG